MHIRKSHLYTLLITGILVFGVFLFGDTVLAQTDFGLADVGSTSGLGQGDIKVAIAGIIRSALGFLGIIAVVMIMYGGMQWMMAGGREPKIQKAQQTIINAVIGLVIILSAMAITQFILNTLVEATTSSGTVSEEEEYDIGNDPFGTGFSVLSMAPSGEIPIRNAVVQVALSSNVDVTTVADNFAVRRVGATEDEPGSVTTNGSVISFIPSAPCPAPNTDEGCFDYDSAEERGVQYEIVVSAGLRGTNEVAVDCGFSRCFGTFTTGALVDITPPEVLITVPSEGTSVSQNPETSVVIQASDDSGVALVTGFVDDEVIGTDSPDPSQAVFVANMTWNDSGLELQSSHYVGAVATDLSGRITTAQDVKVIVRPEHCFDTIVNDGETGLNCGGDPASAEYCGACENDSCTSDAQCSSGLSCIDGSCALLPEITHISPENGAPGSFITISGISLGNSEGVVTFLGDPDNPDDDLIAGLACADSWSNDEVVVAVPVPDPENPDLFDYPIGPIEIKIFNGQTDRTDDANGTILPNFKINDVHRPGICSISPRRGRSGDTVTITGNNFGSGDGSIVAFKTTQATVVSSWTDSSIELKVPSMPLDPFLKDVMVGVNGVTSNIVKFGIDPPELGHEPTIQYIDAASAPMGGTITIFGSNFGFQEGNVVFTDPESGLIAHAGNDFPDVCSGGTWTPDSITVTVPSSFLVEDPGIPFGTGDYNVHVKRTDNQESSDVGFTIDPGLPGPGICRITPLSGPEGTTVDIYGTDFGTSIDTVAFTGADADTISMWEDGHIKANVPEDAVTGLLYVSVSDVKSNQQSFEVGECSVTPDSCGDVARCCPNTLQCKALTDDCEIPTPTSNFLFEWVTGPIPIVPRVIEHCDDTTEIDRVVSPAPWSGRVGGDEVCSNSAITAAFTVDVLNIDTNTVIVEKCLGENCERRSTVTPSAITVQPDRFKWVPDGGFDAGSTYEVTITTGVVAAGEGGEPLPEDYVWRFTTRESENVCDIEGLDVVPGKALLTEVGDGNTDNDDEGDILLSADPYGADSCVYLTFDDDDEIAWSTSNNIAVGGLSVESIAVLGSPTERIIKALHESVDAAVNVFATYVNQGIEAFSSITVDFTDPVVQNYWPNCNSACINGQIGVQFNTKMSANSLSTSTIHLTECENELCVGGQLVDITIPALTKEGSEQAIKLASGTFTPGSFYRVSIDGSVESESGVALTELNYDDSFSWIFRVSSDGNLCTIDHVDVSPRFVTLHAIGERQQFTATPFSVPDACSEGGQRLTRSDYDWDWSSDNNDTAFLIGDGELNLVVTDKCNGSCLFTGSEPGISVCGNGKECLNSDQCSGSSSCVNGSCIEYGEQCDFGTEEANDIHACSSTCLWKGTSACTVSACSVSGMSCESNDDCGDSGEVCKLIGSGCCGNGTLDSAEECDDGAIVNGDGCSSSCLNEGSQAIGSTCGNGDVAYNEITGGEECDDGNSASGDGCSSQCLWEGSRDDNPSVCGNSIIETGEECDDGNIVLGDGCTDRCLYDGGIKCGLDASYECCGNNTVEASNHEQCDGDEGCSDSCLLLGSSIFYSSASICGDGEVDPGEEYDCEEDILEHANAYTDGIQYAEVSVSLASQSVPATGLYKTNITSDAGVVPTKDDSAELFVSCSCQASSDCPGGDGIEFACGIKSGCCAPRQADPVFIPTGQDECRNAEVRVVFDGLIDHSSLFGPDSNIEGNTVHGSANILLRRVNEEVLDQTECEAISGHVFVADNDVNIRYLPQFANNLISDFLNLVRPEAMAIEPGCYMSTTPVAYDVLDHTEVVLRYNGALAANTKYEIVVIGDNIPTDSEEVGVLSVTGAGFVSMNIDGEVYHSIFSTGNEICLLDELLVVDNTGNGYFASANESHEFVATAYSKRASGLTAIQPVDSYSWDTNWSIADGSEIVSLSGDSVDSNGTSVQNVQSLETSGNEYVSAIANVTVDEFFDPTTINTEVSSSERVNVHICEVPWPDDKSIPGHLETPLADVMGNVNGLSPDNDRFTNFSTMYCRAEVAGEGAELPDFLIVEPDTTYAPGVVREILLRHPSAPDAIGIRVLTNEDSLPLQMWYAQHGFAGSPTEIMVDGFSALKDGRTLYVNASNMTSDHTLEHLVYVISYSEGAGADTIEVYNQIVNNWSFNAGRQSQYEISNVRLCTKSNGTTAVRQDGGFYECTADVECVSQMQDLGATCNADVDKIRRDIKRVEDFRVIEKIVESYGETHRHCSATTSLVCIDINDCPVGESCEPDVPLLDAGTFIRGWSTSAWPSWSAELGNELASGLPVDPVNQFLQCPPRVCSTSATPCIVDNDCPGVSDGDKCEESADFDGDTCWNGNESVFRCTAGSHVYRYQRKGIDQYTLAVDMESSQKVAVWQNEVLPVSENATLVFGGFQGTAYGVVQNSCTGTVNYGASEVCGDGVIGGDEVCELGQISSETCSTDSVDMGVKVTKCSPDCRGFEAATSECIPFACGNGVIEGICVGLTHNSDNISCLSDTICGDAPGDRCDFTAGEVCDDGELNGTYGYCGTDCTYGASTSLTCGNGRVEGGEICDNGADNGVYNIDGNGCSWDCTGLPPRYGDGIVNGAEVCDTEYETASSSFDGHPDCEQQGFCVGGTNEGSSCTIATKSDDCPVDPADGLQTTCTMFDTFRSRSCNSVSNKGTWGTWSDCKQQGSCGNGVVDADEQCDDGNKSNTDGCTNICQVNVCGDGFLDPAQESCDYGTSNGDHGTSNGDICTPGYDSTCNYCTVDCSYQTVSGGYCGDGEVNPEGGEICDGSSPLHWVTDYGNAVGGVCYHAGDTGVDANTDDPTTCKQIGVCNGGGDNGEVCILGKHAPYSSSPCADDAKCVSQICDAGCGTSCPFNYQSMYIQATEDDVEGASLDDTVNLFSSSSVGVCDNTSQNEWDGLLCHNDGMCGGGVGNCVFDKYPMSATIEIPACSVASSLQADVTLDYDHKPLEVVFVLDFSNSMDQDFDGNTSATDGFSGPTRRQVMEAALKENISRLYDEYPGPVRVGFVDMTNGGDLDVVMELNSSEWNDTSNPAHLQNKYNSLYGADTCENEPYKVAGARYSYELPTDWYDIVGDGGGVTRSNTNSAACILLWPDNNEEGLVDDFLNNNMSSIASGGHNANAAGLNRAMYMLQQFPADHERVVVHVTNGIPRCAYSLNANDRPSDSNDVECEQVVNRMFNYAASMKNQGMKLYTATIRGNSSGTDKVVGREFQIMSSDCPVLDTYGVKEDDDDLEYGNSLMYKPSTGVSQFTSTYYGNEPNFPYAGNTGVYKFGSMKNDKCISPPRYSYVGDSAGALIGMFDAIVDNVLGTTATLTYKDLSNVTTSSSSMVIPGVGIQMPLPSGFKCTNEAQEIGISTDFAGFGTVSIENFRFLSCSE